MKKITKLWLELHNLLEDVPDMDEFNTEVFRKFGDIFDLKEVEEYKRAKDCTQITPLQFSTTTDVMKRAFVEGYLLAQLEQRKEDIRDLYNIYKKDIKNEICNKPNDSRIAIPTQRTSI